MRYFYIILLSLFILGWDYSDELAKIRYDIKREGFDWVAGETKMLKMIPEERRMYLMPNPPVIIHENVFESDKNILTSYPSRLDYRDFMGYNWMTPIRDQKSCGSCWAFSTLGSLEAIIKMYNSDPFMDLDLSEQELVSCTLTGSCAYGGSQLFAANYIKSSGITDEDCFPYIAQEGDCKDKCTNPKIKEYIKEAGTVGFYSIAGEEDIKAALIKYGPIPTSMKVYSDFYAYKSGVYQKSSNATEEGWHAIVFVGWDDAKNAWLCKNSWGDDFGEKGYFWIKKGDSYIGWGTEYMVYKDELKPRLCSSVNEINLTIDINRSTRKDFDFEVFNCGSWVFEWSGSTMDVYVQLVDKIGVAIKKPSLVRGYVDASSLSTGSYTSYINIKAEAAENSPLMIPVRINVISKEIIDAGQDLYYKDVIYEDTILSDSYEEDDIAKDILLEDISILDIKDISVGEDTLISDVRSIRDVPQTEDFINMVDNNISSDNETDGGCGCNLIE